MRARASEQAVAATPAWIAVFPQSPVGKRAQLRAALPRINRSKLPTAEPSGRSGRGWQPDPACLVRDAPITMRHWPGRRGNA
jgi:hypothetical protein